MRNADKRCVPPHRRLDSTAPAGLPLMVSAMDAFMMVRQRRLRRVNGEAKVKQVMGIETTYVGPEHR
jgi:hypothetical protein